MAETLTNDLLDRYAVYAGIYIYVYAAICSYMQILLDVYELILAPIDSYYMSYIYMSFICLYALICLATFVVRDTVLIDEIIND